MHPNAGEQEETLLLAHQFPAQIAALRNIRELIRTTLVRRHYSSDTTEDIIMAVDEACQNIIRHGYGKETQEAILLHIEQQKETVSITLRDYAPEIEIDRLTPRDLDEIRPGGLGCHFIRHVMDDIVLERPRTGTGNVLRMRKRLS